MRCFPARHGAVRWSMALWFVFAAPLALAQPLNQVLISGQSLSLGVSGAPALAPPGAGDALMFAGGLHHWNTSALVPLASNGTETVAPGFAGQLQASLEAPACTLAEHPLLLSLSGRSATPIAELDFAGGDPHGVYWNAIAQAWWGHQHALALGRTHRVSAMLWLQGESDAGSDGAAYAERLHTLQADVQRHAYAVTGVDGSVPLLMMQTSSEASLRQPSTIAQAQLDASRDNPLLHLVSPAYHLPYVDGLHPSNTGYRWLGGYFAKAYRQAVLEGRPWQPLHPLAATARQDGGAAALTLHYHVPVPPLVLDTQAVSNPGDYGFAVTDAAGAVPIDAVQLVGDAGVRLSLARALQPPAFVRYAYDQPLGAPAGPHSGQRGNLRDSDPATVEGPGGSPLPLYNWSVIFRLPVALY